MGKPFLLLTAIILFWTGCKKPSDNDPAPAGLIQWDILKIDGPTSGSINQVISLKVSCPASSGCDYVSQFISKRNGKIITIKAYGNTHKDINCTMGAVTLTVNYNFIPLETGELVLIFRNKDNSEISYNITIN